jgi:outer membrane protein TolC
LISINFIVCAQGNSLTLKEAISSGLNSNPGIKSAKQMLESYSHSYLAARSGYLPRVDVVLLANKIDNSVALDFNDMRKAIISADLTTYRLLGGENPSLFQQTLNKNIPPFEKKF